MRLSFERDYKSPRSSPVNLGNFTEISTTSDLNALPKENKDINHSKGKEDLSTVIVSDEESAKLTNKTAKVSAGNTETATTIDNKISESSESTPVETSSSIPEGFGKLFDLQVRESELYVGFYNHGVRVYAYCGVTEV